MKHGACRRQAHPPFPGGGRARLLQRPNGSSVTPLHHCTGRPPRTTERHAGAKQVTLRKNQRIGVEPRSLLTDSLYVNSALRSRSDTHRGCLHSTRFNWTAGETAYLHGVRGLPHANPLKRRRYTHGLPTNSKGCLPRWEFCPVQSKAKPCG